ncbi:MAG: hypothetical protein V1755_07800 [Chloroflexota bacterium]
MKPVALSSTFLIAGLLFLTSCSTPSPAGPGAAPAATSTPDPCSAENLVVSVNPLNDLMRQFDDYAALASNVAQSELLKVIPPMQAIRRAAQDQIAPTCLVDLKRFELLYMDSVLQTLLAFQKPNPNIAVLGTGIVASRQYHDQYSVELARLLGVTLTTATPIGTPAP